MQVLGHGEAFRKTGRTGMMACILRECHRRNERGQHRVLQDPKSMVRIISEVRKSKTIDKSLLLSYASVAAPRRLHVTLSKQPGLLISLKHSQFLVAIPLTTGLISILLTDHGAFFDTPGTNMSILWK